MSSPGRPASTGDTGDNEFVVVANRLPVDRVGDAWQPSPGGLVAALAPVLRSRAGCWVGWPGNIAEGRSTSTHSGGDVGYADVPFRAAGITMVPLALDQEDYDSFYEGFANSTLWPLYHDLIVAPEYNETWWQRYVDVNQRFAQACAATTAPGGTVWVQDYQLQLVPGMLKVLRPDVKIGFFLHIPFPPPELFRQLPWRDEIIAGLAQADLVGFQRDSDEANFRALAPDTRTGTFPISIDVGDFAGGDTQQQVAKIRSAVGDPDVLMLGVDRMDYTKGILQRLTAFEQLLESGFEATLIQLAIPSRERISHYQQTRREVEEAVGRINGRFAQVGRPVIHYLHRGVSKTLLHAYYAAADIMLVTPFKDGMNLVAKEYVAAHPDGSGALVLSEFAGAAVELHQAYLCNPFDLASITAAITAATAATAATDAAARQDTGADSARARMLAMHAWVREHDVNHWAGSFLEALG